MENRPLRLININCHSIVGKKTEILNLVDSTKPDIIVATETWLDSNIKNSEILPEDYEVFRKDMNRNGGGVLIAVRKELDCYEVPEFQEDCELVWARIKLRGQRTLYICAFYRPDMSDKTSFPLLTASLRKVATINNAHIVIAGDLNFLSWDWKSIKLKPNGYYPQLHKDLIDTLNDFSLVQVVEEPTRERNTLDLVITNYPQQIPRIEILPGLSDHDAVFCEITVTTPKKEVTPKTNTPLKKKQTGVK